MTECLLIDSRDCDEGTFGRILGLLSEERYSKVLGYRFMSDKVMSAVAGLVEEHLKNRFGSSIDINPDGKPDFSDGAHHFNISHSGGYVLFAVSDNPVGVDVQSVTPDTDIAKAILSPEELVSMRGGITCENLTSVWCRKESYLKLTGEGLSTDPRTLTVHSVGSFKGNRFYEGAVPGFCYAVCHSDPECRFGSVSLDEWLASLNISE